MQDMIERIVEMDKAARAMTRQVKNEKLSLAQEVKDLKESIREDYLTRARKRIELNRETEQKLADERIEKVKSDEINIAKSLDENYDKSHEAWVETIVKHVLED